MSYGTPSPSPYFCFTLTRTATRPWTAKTGAWVIRVWFFAIRTRNCVETIHKSCTSLWDIYATSFSNHNARRYELSLDARLDKKISETSSFYCSFNFSEKSQGVKSGERGGWPNSLLPVSLSFQNLQLFFFEPFTPFNNWVVVDRKESACASETIVWQQLTWLRFRSGKFIASL